MCMQTIKVFNMFLLCGTGTYMYRFVMAGVTMDSLRVLTTIIIVLTVSGKGLHINLYNIKLTRYT